MTIKTKKIIILLLLAMCFRFTSMVYVVNGESMEPSLHNRDIGVAVRATLIRPNRFDTVIIKQNNKYLIKRVIGLPNEFVVYRDNKLYINGKYVEDYYGVGTTSEFEKQLGIDEYYCLGDNRENSSDSRVYGAFNINDIKAVTVKQ